MKRKKDITSSSKLGTKNNIGLLIDLQEKMFEKMFFWKDKLKVSLKKY